MAQSLLEIIFKTAKQGQGGKQAAAELKELKDKVGEVSSGLIGMNLGAVTATGAVVALGNFVRQSVNEWSVYAESVGKAADAAGVSAEEMSRLMQAADDARVPIESLENAMKIAQKNGFQPTIENMAKLADELAGMNSPTERAAKLSKIFGKSWQDIYPLLKDGGANIRQMTAAIDDSLVVTDEAVKANREYIKALDDLGDAWQGTKNEIGRTVIPALTSMLQTVNASNRALQENKGIWDNVLAAMPGVGVAYRLITAEQQKQKDAIAASGLELMKYNSSMDVGAGAAGMFSREAKGVSAGVEEIGKKARDAKPDVDDFVTSVLKLDDIDPNFGSKVANALDELDFMLAGGLPLQNVTESIQKAVEAGKVTPAQARDMFAEVFIASEALKVQMGKINADEAAKNIQTQLGGSLDEAKRKLDAIAAQLSSLPDKISIDIQVNEIVNRFEDTSRSHNYELPIQVNTGGQKSAKGEANGGIFTVPPGYPNDSYRVGLSSGETVIVVNDRMRATGQSAPIGAQVTIGPNYIQSEMDYRAWLERVKYDLRKAGIG